MWSLCSEMSRVRSDANGRGAGGGRSPGGVGGSGFALGAERDIEEGAAIVRLML